MFCLIVMIRLWPIEVTRRMFCSFNYHVIAHTPLKFPTNVITTVNSSTNSETLCGKQGCHNYSNNSATTRTTKPLLWWLHLLAKLCSVIKFYCLLVWWFNVAFHLLDVTTFSALRLKVKVPQQLDMCTCLHISKSVIILCFCFPLCSVWNRKYWRTYLRDS